MSSIPQTESGSSTSGITSAHPEEQFVGFVKESVGFIVALTASIPLLADYFKLVALPNLGIGTYTVNEKLLPLIATLASSVIFLAFFWARDKLRTIYWLSGGTALFLVGIGLLTYQQIVLHTHGEEIKLFILSAIFATPREYEAVIYLLGFVSIVAGIAIVFLYGFVRHQERWATMQQILPQLDPDQYAILFQEARLQMEINDAFRTSVIQKKANAPLKASIALLNHQHVTMLKDVSRGTLDQIRGPAMDDVMQVFTEGIKGEFRALSKDDLKFWASVESRRYLDINKQLIDQKVNIERIFLISPKSLSEEHKDAIWEQLKMGIHVYLCSLENARKTWEDENDLDFALLDGYAVSFWRSGGGRFFRISTSDDDCKKHTKIYENVKRMSTAIPHDIKKCETEAEKNFTQWMSHNWPKGDKGQLNYS